jgi:hypothetical protein
VKPMGIHKLSQGLQHSCIHLWQHTLDCHGIAPFGWGALASQPLFSLTCKA